MLFSLLLVLGLVSKCLLISDSASFSDAEKQQIEDNVERFAYEADISRIMNIIINSLYKNKEIFIRELISNANDAIGKVKFMSFTNPDVLSTKEELAIWLDYHEENRKLTITDSGIGMTKEDLVRNLGTIAKSGTSDFLKKLQEAESSGTINPDSLSNQIGQFGVGFYSSFLVAERVTVVSKHNDDDQYIWESDAVSFNVSKDPRGNTLGRGTAITLHLKKQAKEYAQWTKLKELCVKYSSFIDYPIKLWGEMIGDEGEVKDGESKEAGDDTKEKETEGDDDDKKEKEAEGDDDTKEKEAEGDDDTKEKETEGDDDDTKEKEAEGDDDEIKEEEAKDKKSESGPSVPEKKYGYTVLNNVKPIWMRDASNITSEEYTAFYRSLKNEPNGNFLTKIHFVAEGDVVFRCLLFVPETLPSQFSKDEETPLGNVKLYVKRVYIKTDSHSMMPSYMNYISGIIDSDDLPLNVGRESLQHLQLVKVIKKKVVRKVIDAISKLDNETMFKFYKAFSVPLKYGAIVDDVNRNRLLKILRYHSTVSKEGNMTTFSEYVSRMKKNQDKIYFITATEYEDCAKSPYVTPFTTKGYEVFCMLDSMDEYLFTHISDFENRKFQNIAKDGSELPDEESPENEEKAKEYKPLAEFLPKESKLSGYIERADVVFDIEPACLLIANKYGFTGSMERVYNSQTSQSSVEKDHMHETMMRKKNLRLNGNHPLVKAMLDHIDEGNGSSEEFDELARTCYSIGQLYGGFVHDNHKKLAEVMQDLSVKALGQDPKEVRERVRQRIGLTSGEEEESKPTEEKQEEL